jgi:probable rRNA maturation factor
MALRLELIQDDGLTSEVSMLALSGLVAFAAQHEPSLPRGEWDVTVRLTDDERIADIHREFFGDASATDVISFPSGEPLNIDAGYLGDIVISITTADSNAAAAGHSGQREVAFLLLHGLLHLAGHSDAHPDEKRRMLERQQDILEAFEQHQSVPW